MCVFHNRRLKVASLLLSALDSPSRPPPGQRNVERQTLATFIPAAETGARRYRDPGLRTCAGVREDLTLPKSENTLASLVNFMIAFTDMWSE